MRIVSKAELMALPKGTLFADYSPVRWPAGPEMILQSASALFDGQPPADFEYRSINQPDADDWLEALDYERDMEENGTSYPVDLSVGREGLYDPETRYLVWEPDDVRRIVALLLGADKDEKDDE